MNAHLDAVSQDVLAVAGAEMQTPKQIDQPFVQAVDVGLHAGLFAEFLHVPFEFLLCACDDFLDARRMDASVGNQLFERKPGHLAADHVEGADDHHAGRVVDDHIHAGRFLEGSDVAALAADDAALHLVVRNADGARGAFGRVGGRVTLNGGQQHLAGLLLTSLGQPVLVGQDRGARLFLKLVAEDFQESAGGLVLAQAAQFVQRLALEIQQLGKLILSAVGFLDAFGQFALGAFDDFLLLADRLGLFFERILAFVQQPLAFVQFTAQPAKFLFAFGLLLECGLLDLQLGLAATVFRLDLGLANDVLSLGLGIAAAQTVQQPCDKKT